MIRSKRPAGGCSLPTSRFQSLFSWMFPSKSTARDQYPVVEYGFNPCSLGCFARSGRYRGNGPDLWFQSLFSWMISLEEFRLYDSWYTSMFQSLFSWMIRSKTGHVKGRKNRPGFQSLFSWMIRSKYVSAQRGLPGRHGFQSLFSWMIRSKRLGLVHIVRRI